jgi:hypothetical protein
LAVNAWQVTPLNCHPERSGVRAANGTQSKDLRFARCGMNADPSTARPPFRNNGAAKKDCGRFAQDDKS